MTITNSLFIIVLAMITLLPAVSCADALDDAYETHLKYARPVTIKRLMDLFDKEWDIFCGGLAVYKKATHIFIDEAGVIYFDYEGKTHIKRGDYTLTLSK
jgi:hypothetical protein